MGLLTDKVVVITGSGRGIGKETAKICASEGARVVINDIDPEPALETVEEIRKNGGQATAYIGDISDESAAADLINLAKNAFGKIDALVNNAGVTRDALLVRMETEKWDEIMRIHLRGAFLCTKNAVAEMIKQKTGGVIINLSSPAGLRGNIGQANYSAAKAGLMGFTLTLAKELERYKIRVNAIAPIAWTRLTQAIPEDVLKKRGEEFAQKLKSAKPEFVGHLISFLISDKAEGITGQIFGVFGEEFHIWSPPKIVFRKTKSGGFTIHDYVVMLDEILSNIQKPEEGIG
jgi:NAD(P)-dependent dehydrogenase (short-subunit alcohol dehydrogenase family)